jgi:hypothetical protein
MVPHDGPLQPAPETVQVTAVFDAPVTEAANCWVAPMLTDAEAGVTATATTGGGGGATRDTVADAYLAGSATLVAVTLTTAGVGTAAGVV